MDSPNFRDLKVWQLGMQLAEDVYRVTQQFPKHEVYGLASQLQRSAVSLPSNIAEGHGRNSNKEFNHYSWNSTWFFGRVGNATHSGATLELFD